MKEKDFIKEGQVTERLDYPLILLNQLRLIAEQSLEDIGKAYAGVLVLDVLLSPYRDKKYDKEIEKADELHEKIREIREESLQSAYIAQALLYRLEVLVKLMKRRGFLVEEETEERAE